METVRLGRFLFKAVDRKPIPLRATNRPLDASKLGSGARSLGVTLDGLSMRSCLIEKECLPRKREQDPVLDVPLCRFTYEPRRFSVGEMIFR